MIACVDIGGCTTRIGLSQNGKKINQIIKIRTEDSFQDEINQIICIIKKNISIAPEAIIVAAAGSLNRKNGTIISWGQKRSWWGQNIFTPLAKNFPQAHLLIENDANMAALGEATFGAGKEYSLVAYLTISSGIGGCLIINQQIVPHFFGLEPGHQIINASEEKTWSCGQRGCFESYASGTAFAKIYGVRPENCNSKNIWTIYGQKIAPGIANMITFWSPEILIIGGGVSKKFELFSKTLIDQVASLLPMYQLPKIVKAKLDEPGLYGDLAYWLGRQKT